MHRATLAALFAALPIGLTALPAEAQFALKFGRAGGDDASWGDGPGEFFDPEKLVVDPTNGDVLVSDVLNHRIQRFDARGGYVETFGTMGSGNGQFNSPRGIDVDPTNGDIYVVDSLNDRVQVFSASGTYLRKWGSSGSGTGQLSFPRDIALDGNGNAFVTDMDNHRVQKFTASTGGFVAEWGQLGEGDGEFEFPRGIAVHDSGDVFVVDSFNHRVQRFTSSGTLVSMFGKNGGDGSFGTGNGEFNTPRGITIRGDQIWVADTGNDRVQVFTIVAPDSIPYSSQFGLYGIDDGQLHTPRGVAVDAAGATQYVASSGSHRIDAFGSPAFSKTQARVVLPELGHDSASGRRPGLVWPLEVELEPRSADPMRLTAVVRYELPEATDVRLRLADAAGRALVVLDEGSRAAGVHTVEWSAADYGRSAGVGPVEVQLETKAGVASRSIRVP